MANFQGKVPDELYDELEELKKQTGGGTHAEFVERMMEAYKLSRLKYGESLLSSEVEELEGLTVRINKILINANEKINSALKNKDIQHEEKQSANEELIARLRKDLEELKENNAEIKKQLDEANTSNKELTQKLEENEDQLSTTKELVSQYKEKNENLSSMITEYKQDREENKQLREEISTLKENLLEAQNKANSETQKVLSLTKEKETMEQEHKDKLHSIEVAHKQQISYLESMKANEVNEARLKEKEQAQAKIEAHMDKENELRNDMDNLKKVIDSLKEDKEKALLELKGTHEKEVSALQKEVSELKAALQNNTKKTSKAKAKTTESETE